MYNIGLMHTHTHTHIYIYIYIYKECEFEGIYVICFLRKKIPRKNL